MSRFPGSAAPSMEAIGGKGIARVGGKWGVLQVVMRDRVEAVVRVRSKSH
jgi:hypothetical protein